MIMMKKTIRKIQLINKVMTNYSKLRRKNLILQAELRTVKQICFNNPTDMTLNQPV